jgi:hypothetical protein
VLIADQTLIRTGFRLIPTTRGINVVGDAADGLEAVAAARELGVPHPVQGTGEIAFLQRVRAVPLHRAVEVNRSPPCRTTGVPRSVLSSSQPRA